MNEDLLLKWLEHTTINRISTHVSVHELDRCGCYTIERDPLNNWQVYRTCRTGDVSNVLIASPRTLNDAKQAAQYHFECLQGSKSQAIEKPEMPVIASTADCDFHYFKPSGKWYASGEGRFPSGKLWKLDRNMIVAENGSMPGVSGRAEEFTIVVIPRDNCQSEFACPMMIAPGAVK